MLKLIGLKMASSSQNM